MLSLNGEQFGLDRMERTGGVVVRVVVVVGRGGHQDKVSWSSDLAVLFFCPSPP